MKSLGKELLEDSEQRGAPRGQGEEEEMASRQLPVCPSSQPPLALTPSPDLSLQASSPTLPS